MIKKGKICNIKASELKCKSFEKRREFVIALRLLEAAIDEKKEKNGRYSPTKGVFTCFVCDLKGGPTGTYEYTAGNVKYTWDHLLLHCVEDHYLIPPQPFIDAILKRQEGAVSKKELKIPCKIGDLHLSVDKERKGLGLVLAYRNETGSSVIKLDKPSADELTEFLKLYFDKG